jgi:ABC-type cobalamin transport system permease subunit
MLTVTILQIFNLHISHIEGKNHLSPHLSPSKREELYAWEVEVDLTIVMVGGDARHRG